MVNGTMATPSGVGILLRGRSGESLNSLKSHDPKQLPREKERARGTRKKMNPIHVFYVLTTLLKSFWITA